jgi:hypothetical protein
VSVHPSTSDEPYLLVADDGFQVECKYAGEQVTFGIVTLFDGLVDGGFLVIIGSTEPGGTDVPVYHKPLLFQTTPR